MPWCVFRVHIMLAQWSYSIHANVTLDACVPASATHHKLHGMHARLLAVGEGVVLVQVRLCMVCLCLSFAELALCVYKTRRAKLH